MQQERIWIVYASLGILAAAFAFFIVAPAVLGFPLDGNAGEVTRVLQIVVPVFLAYLSAATAFLFSPPQQDVALAAERQKLLRVLTRGPVFVAGGGIVLVTGVFWFSNRSGGDVATGMSLDSYCWFLTALVGLLAATTGITVGSIFPGSRNAEDSGSGATKGADVSTDPPAQ